MGKVTALVGAQFGSEGKGVVASALAEEYGVHVRTGGPNAGHTIWHEGHQWKMRSVPCGWVNPHATLCIGAGAVIDIHELKTECDDLEDEGYEIYERLMIDPRASVILPGHKKQEDGVNGQAHQRIGSTGEGIGPCRMAKIARGTVDVQPFDGFLQARDILVDPFKIGDVASFLQRSRDVDLAILLEGTQGSGLSLTHGDWPFCTSADTNAAQLAADAGLPPQHITNVVLVARVHPIRVAGNSGPLHGETTWEELGQEPEKTTVTLKTRRVGQWDVELFAKAMRLNDPTEVVLSFCDYDPDLADAIGTVIAQEYHVRVHRQFGPRPDDIEWEAW